MTRTMQFRLSGEQLTLGYAETQVLRDIDVSIPDGRITAMIGPNGSGKSTLLKALGRFIQPFKGVVYLDGKEISQMSSRQVARKLALLPQSPISPDGLTVRQLCRFGRHPHKGLFSRFSGHDEEMVETALAATSMTELGERPLDRLSGGQRQRAWIAMALAQETAILLLDEPTTYLDIAHQFDVLELLKELNQKHARTVVMVVHDLNHAAQYADHIIAVADRRIYAVGSPADLLTQSLIKSVFGVEAHVIPHPINGTPFCLPYASVSHA
ncbi:ABC transporter ATP-binding protein [Phyllobacterium endophyticum]|uniref:Fe(3+)-dicitrate ABC transporter ATP-binding protein n=1 Tax=Phyllobacterium endophyticum TaxID=1149773 RepID=A0A2P7B1V6_9HYPH|nr:ABC transporter ATP-binding protein [Phyllobacterium endophyticum]MBB3238042.1 iron complex transport system ATP-binding protein [Phyllobacterium endophyticum]PSH60456.1 Fe(3+)-dicitrate ABC transporter ATP-binding protein [Phyllobacterium endophyticum]TYR42633.1 ABC transporter ATP-binding protein [Phyllobacterium endophyticum]